MIMRAGSATRMPCIEPFASAREQEYCTSPQRVRLLHAPQPAARRSLSASLTLVLPCCAGNAASDLAYIVPAAYPEVLTVTAMAGQSHTLRSSSVLTPRLEVLT